MSLNILEFAGQLADMKDVDYKNTLAVATVIELLIAKGYFTREEFAAKAAELDQASLAEIIHRRRAKIQTK
ncbi:MAG: hypothetical protein P4N41_15060 [Negativicutes bacterium]|nr:hypothetical protein [Negativicutes bacterium]